LFFKVCWLNRMVQQVVVSIVLQQGDVSGFISDIIVIKNETGNGYS